MKKFLCASLFLIFTGSLFAQSNGTLTLSVTTSDAGGNYRPKNIVAIWVEDSSNKFVKTLLAYADRRKEYLYTWKSVTNNAGSAFNTVDAITGATRSGHSTISCSWDGKDLGSATLPDGVYTVHMELTDKHEQGNYVSFNFLKSSEAQLIEPANVTGFSNISISWVPQATGTETVSSNAFTIYPNPTSNKVSVSGVGIKSLSVYNLSGKKEQYVQGNVADLSQLPHGVYLLSIETENGTISQKVKKQ